MKTFKMVGPGPFQSLQSFALGVGPWGRRPATRHLKGNNLREGSKFAAPTAPKRNVENLKRVRSPAGATISKVCLRPIGAATPLPPQSSALLADGTESAMGARPPPRLAGVGIRRLSTRWQRFCHFRFVPGPPGEEGWSLKFVKRESLPKWAVRPSLPGQRTSLEWPLRRPSGLRATPGGSLTNPSVRLALQESSRWKVEGHRPSHAVGAGSLSQGAGRKMKI